MTWRDLRELSVAHLLAAANCLLRVDKGNGMSLNYSFVPTIAALFASVSNQNHIVKNSRKYDRMTNR